MRMRKKKIGIWILVFRQKDQSCNWLEKDQNRNNLLGLFNN